MSTEYSVESLQHLILSQHASTSVEAIAALRAFQERIKADEGAAAFGWVTDDYRTDKSTITYDKTVADRWAAKGWPVTAIFTHPPARAAQVDALRWLAVSCDPHKLTGAFAVDHARRAFGMCPFKDDPSYATAEPVAQSEADAWMTPGGDVSRSYLWCAERCRDEQRPRPLYLAAQPAQSVDVDMVREVILQLRAYQRLHEKWPDAFPDMELEGEANKLTAALQEKGNG